MAALPRATSRQEYEQWFKDADKNQDGFLTAKELKKLLKSKGCKTSSKVFKQQFASWDSDSDKKISLDEYLKAVKDIPDDKLETSPDSAEPGSQEQYEKWFREADVNKDGFLTAKELKKMLKSKGLKMSSKAAKSYFETLDRDNDKKITLTEYLEAMGHVAADVSQDSVKTSDPLAAFRPPGVTDVPKDEKSHDATGTQSKQQQVTSQRDESTETSDEYTVVSESRIRALFKEADTNGDGFLDVDEMKRVLSKTHTGLTNKQLFDIMYKADSDKSGLINYNEFLVLWIKEHGLLKD